MDGMATENETQRHFYQLIWVPSSGSLPLERLTETTLNRKAFWEKTITIKVKHHRHHRRFRVPSEGQVAGSTISNKLASMKAYDSGATKERQKEQPAGEAAYVCMHGRREQRGNNFKKRWRYRPCPRSDVFKGHAKEALRAHRRLETNPP